MLSLGAVLVYFIAVFLGVPGPILGEFQGSFGGDLGFFFQGDSLRCFKRAFWGTVGCCGCILGHFSMIQDSILGEF